MELAEFEFTRRTILHRAILVKLCRYVRAKNINGSPRTVFLFAPEWLAYISNPDDGLRDERIPDEPSASILTWFQDVDIHSEVLYFYIDVYDRDDPIKYVSKRRNDGDQTYTQDNQVVPHDGVIGSPIIAARVRVDNRGISWDFKVDSILSSCEEQDQTILLRGTPLQNILNRNH